MSEQDLEAGADPFVSVGSGTAGDGHEEVIRIAERRKGPPIRRTTYAAYAQAEGRAAAQYLFTY